MSDKFNVSIVIPIFNAEEYIEKTLNSVANQSETLEIEVLLINDGSTDNSIQHIENYIDRNKKKNIHYKLYNDGENLGQGARRNFGIEIAQGETILFLDSDDLLVENAIDVAYKQYKANDENDFVIFEWAYYYPEKNQTIYVNKEKYNQELALYKTTCELLLACSTYFTVNKLYKREFLIEHDIKFGEGYIYEDFEFYIKVALRAWRAPVIPNIFYKVRVHEKSTTKTDYNNLKHYHSFLKAIKKSSEILNSEGTRDINSSYNVNKYFIYRALLYSEKRLPKSKKIKRDFIYKTMQIINQYSPNTYVPKNIIPLYHHAFHNKLIANYEVSKLQKIFKLHREGKINFYSHRLNKKKQKKKKLKQKIESNYFLEPIVYHSRRYVHKRRKEKKDRKQQNLLSKRIIPGTILMLGFDYRYQGNSKYLFDYLKDFLPPTKLKFVTFDTKVHEQYRIEPRSNQFFDLFYSSEFIIAESWMPLAFRKSDNQKWIQLWHGTPFKKMVFDSSESQMLRLNPNHKVRIKNDIARWDYLLSDSSIAKDIFSSAFDFPKNKILNYGYPRNEWLVKNINNHNLIKKLKVKFHIPFDKKIILYTPTWRDYNYKKNQRNQDTSYVADLELLLSYLGDDYIVINKSHSMDKKLPSENFNHKIYTINDSVDSQELILLSDLIVTDYSSIFFDAIHINKPFYFLTKDISKFNLVRGFYSKIYQDFYTLFTRNEEELADQIKNNTFDQLDIYDKYKNENIVYSSKLINEFIKNLSMIDKEKDKNNDLMFKENSIK